MGKIRKVADQKVFLLQRFLEAALNRARAIDDKEIEIADQTRVELMVGKADQLQQLVDRIKDKRGIK